MQSVVAQSRRLIRVLNQRKKAITAFGISVVFALTAFLGDAAFAAAGYPNPNDHGSSTETFVSGAYIIDAGYSGTATKQTIAQGIKPYGLIYALVKAKVPVQWVINSAKGAISQTLGNAAADFTFDCDGSGSAYASKAYSTGAFVIPKEFAAQAKDIVATWTAKGVKVDGPCTQDIPNLPVFATIAGWPRAVLDAQNGSVAAAYFANAEIPQGVTTDPMNPQAYKTAAPSQLTPCDDIYIMPHADPTYATHSSLINFIKAGGSFYASCHAVSEIENMEYPTGTKVMNLLATNGLVHYNSHSQGSLPYSFMKLSSDTVSHVDSSGGAIATVRSGDPIAQFKGVTDASTQNGSEQIYIPKSGSAWRPTTQIITYDPTQTNAYASGNTGPATSLLYGPAYGNTDYGWVMYQGGHSVNKGTVDDVASQRAFFNFLLLTAVDRRLNGSTATTRNPSVTISEPAANTTISGGSSIPVAGASTGGSGSYTYKWASQCFNSSGNAVASGTFLDDTKAKTTFTAPDVAGNVNCNMTLTVVDTCGRYAFGYSSVVFAPEANVSITKSSSPTTASINSEVTYTLTVTNNGKTAGTTSGDGNVATSVTLTDPLPSGTTLVSVSSPSYTGTAPSGSTCTNDGSTVSCDLRDMADEQVATVQITVTIDPSSRGLILDNTARVTSTSADSTPGNNTATTSTTIRNSGIAIDVTTDKAYADRTSGSSVIYTYTVTNPGTSALASVSVTDQNGTMSNGDDITPTFIGGDSDTDNSLDTNETWTYRSTRSVSSATNDLADDALDKTKRTVATAQGNDGSAVVSANDDVVITLVTPHITLSKTPATQLVTAGNDASFTLSATNDSDGPVAINDIEISDTYDTGGSLSCQVGAMPHVITSLPAGETWKTTCKIVAITGSGTNTLRVTGGNNPLTGSPMVVTSSAVSITAGTPPLQLIKSVSPSGVVAPGDTITYKLSLTNTSATPQTGVTLTDELAPGLTAGTATITRSDSSGSSGKTAGVIAWDKFNYTAGNTTPSTWNASQGFSASTTSWSTSGTSTSTNKGISISQKCSSSCTAPSDKEEKSVKVAITGGKTSIVSRSVDLSSSKEAVTVLFECAASAATGASLTVSLGSFTSSAQSCTTTSRKSFSIAVDASYYSEASATAKQLSFTFTGTGTSGSAGPVMYLDDVFVVAGMAQSDSFTGTSSGSSYTTNGFGWAGTTWSETDSAGKLSLSTASTSRFGSLAYWSGSSSNSGIMTRTYSLSSTDYSSANLSFSCFVGNSTLGSSFIKVEVGSGGVYSTKFDTATDTNPCVTNVSLDSSMTRSSNIALGTLSSGERTIRVTLGGSSKLGFDDLIIAGVGKGAATSTTTATLTSALAGPYSLAANEKIEISFTATVANPYPVAGATVITNQASASSAQQTTPSSSSVTSPLAIADYNIVKSVTADHLSSTGGVYTVRSGQSVTYTYTVTNSGTVDITSPVVADPACSTMSSPTKAGPAAALSDGVLNAGETWTYTCNAKTLTSTDAGTVTLNGQTLDEEATLSAGSNVYVAITEDSDALTVHVVNPSLVVAASPTSKSIYAGRMVSYTYTVTATGGDVSNPVVTAENCTNIRYASGDTNADRIVQTTETWTFTCVTAAINANQSGKTVTAVGSDTYVGQQVTSNSVTVGVTIVLAAGLAITSTVQDSVSSTGPSSTISVGANNALTYRYTVMNTGFEPITNVKVIDDHCATVTYLSGDTNTDTIMQPTETWLFRCVQASAVSQKTISNASASGTDPLAATVTSDSSTNTVNVLAPGVLLTIFAGTEYAHVGDSVDYLYNVQNYGETNITSFTPVDDHCSPLVRNVTDETGDKDSVLEPGEIWVYNCSASNMQADTLSTFSLTSVVDATVGTAYSPTATSVKVFVIDPSLQISQTVTSYVGATATLRDGPGTSIDALVGDTLVFNYHVQASKGINASNVDGLNSILISEIADAQCDNLVPLENSDGYNVGDTVNTGQLDPSETWHFTCETTALTATTGTKTSAATLTAQSTLDDPTTAPSNKLAYFSLTSTTNTIVVTAAPTITTNNASSVQSSSAVISGTAIWGDLDTAVSLCYGTAADLTGCTTVLPAPRTIVTGGAQNFVYTLTGLIPGQTYYFRAHGQNASGSAQGVIKSFTTVVSAPTATTQAATSVTRYAATLNGSVSWGGASTSTSFCYGTASDLTGCTTENATPGTISSDGAQSVTVSLSGLTSNTRYYFRVIGTNAQGTTRGAIMSFTTSVGILPRHVTPRIRGNSSSTPQVYQGSTGVLTPLFSAGTGSVTYSITTSSVCSIDALTNEITFLDLGDCEVDVTSPSTSDYEAATHTPLTIKVIANPQTITTKNPGRQSWQGSRITIALNQKSTSGLTVTLQSLTPKVCIIQDGFVIVIGPGTCSVVATRGAGTNANKMYDAAKSKTTSFVVADEPLDTVAAPAVTPSASPTAAPTVAPQPSPSSGSGAVQAHSTGVRNVGEAAAEVIEGFVPGRGITIKVTGSRIAGQFVVTPGSSADALGVAAAIEESTQRTETDFAAIKNVAPVATTPQAKEIYSAPITADARKVFAASGLAAPVNASSLKADRSTKWLKVDANVTTYVPGSEVYLVVTTQPVIIGSATVGRDGRASLNGLLPLSALANGGHNLRLVGIRQIDGVSSDAQGRIQLSDAAMAAIKAFDAGTKATVEMVGTNASGATQSAIREIPLDKEIPWWTVWLASMIAVLALVASFVKPPVRFRRRIVAASVDVAAGLPAVVLGWLTASYEVWIGFGISILSAAVILISALRKKKKSDAAE